MVRGTSPYVSEEGSEPTDELEDELDPVDLPDRLDSAIDVKDFPLPRGQD